MDDDVAAPFETSFMHPMVPETPHVPVTPVFIPPILVRPFLTQSTVRKSTVTAELLPVHASSKVLSAVIPVLVAPKTVARTARMAL